MNIKEKKSFDAFPAPLIDSKGNGILRDHSKYDKSHI
jgi:hypothetical protein